MEFDEFGHLFPYEIIQSDLSTIELYFVKKYPSTTNRTALFAALHSFLDELRQIINTDFCVWIDGSFITQKLQPNDIDILIFVENDILIKQEKTLKSLKNRFFSEIDSYFIAVLQPNHKKYFLYEMNRKE